VTPEVRAGIWRLADPKVSLASVAAMFLGAAAAAAAGPLHLGWLAITVAGILALETAKNASGEVFDYDSGTDLAVTAADRSPFSGGKRVMVDKLLTRPQTWRVATAAYAIAIAAGLTIAAWREPGVLGYGAAGVALAFFYHAPPLRLSYRGWGELAVAACYGPLITAGTYLVQRGDVPSRVLLLGVPLGIAIGAFLWINEFPDYRADRASGKRNLVVRLGRRAAARWFAVLMAAAFLGLALLPLAGWSRGVWAGAVGALPAAAAVRTLRRYPGDTPRVVPAQGQTLLAFLLLSLGCAVGLLVS
jgi:1,4-dihydroxy-2-naphthoate octaprenyltransferase